MALGSELFFLRFKNVYDIFYDYCKNVIEPERKRGAAERNQTSPVTSNLRNLLFLRATFGSYKPYVFEVDPCILVSVHMSIFVHDLGRAGNLSKEKSRW